MDNLTFKKAEERDKEFVFYLANDREVRNASFSMHEISWEEHCRWFDNLLQDENTLLYLCQAGSVTVGQLRFSLQGEKAVISYSILADYRGKGFGRRMLSLGEELIKKEHGQITELMAEVKKDNLPSINIFESLCYKGEPKEEMIVFRKRTGEIMQ